MLTAHKMRRKPRHFARLTGLTPEDFDQLLCALEPVYQEQRAAALARPNRKRARGGGRTFDLPLGERLLATLLYYRLYVSGTLLSYLFDLDESNLSRERTQRMLPALGLVLPVPMQDHLLSALESSNSTGDSKSDGQRPRRIDSLEELLRAHPELQELVIDVTEQEVPKPQHKSRKKSFYSGKSHCHTLKTQLTTGRRLILHTFGGCPGSLADSTMLKASGVLPVIDAAAATAATATAVAHSVRLDRGYSGIDNSYAHLPAVQLLVALKGTSRLKVTLLGRLWNRLVVARQRIQVEQNIGHLKNWRVLAGLYRGRPQHHAACFAVVAGLHNFGILGALNW